jgi:hypothetical protein
MPRRDWLRYVAVRGFLIVALSLPLTGLAQEDNPREQSESEQAHSTKQNTDAQPNSTTSFIRLEWGKEKNETNWGKPQCEQPRTHDEADLCEQRRMSDAAKDAVWLNTIQTWIGGLGAFLLLLTVIFGFAGTWAAVKSANAIIAMERAYLFIIIHPDVAQWLYGVVKNELSMLLDDRKRKEWELPFIEYHIVNHGKTPAIVVGLRVGFENSGCCPDTLGPQQLHSEIVLRDGDVYPPPSSR